MKKMMLIPAIAAVAGMTMLSCSDSSSKADQQLAQLVSANEGKTDPSVSYGNKTLTYLYDVEPATFSRINQDSLRTKTLTALNGPANASLLKTLTEAGANVQYVYVSGTDTLVMTFTPDEFKK